jgi:predicted P-loop ATPase
VYEAADGAIAPDDISAPQPITRDELEGCKSAIISQIGQLDPLVGLSAETEEQLLRLAYTDIMGLERLEREIKAALIDANAGEPAARKFNLKSYVRGANQFRKKLQETNSRRAKLRERSLRLVAGGKKKRNTDVAIPEETPLSIEAQCEAHSVFLRACGLLRLTKGRRIWFDTFHADYMTDWRGDASDDVIPARKIDDAFLLSVHEYLLSLDVGLGQSGSTNTEKAIHRVADQDRRSEPKQWVEALRWDGQERLPTMLHRAYGTPQDAYHAAVGRCWMTAMAARICDPGCKMDCMPVFLGAQGNGKSTSLSIIGGAWYSTINTVADSKDFVDALRGVLVAEIAELDAIHSHKVENSRVKTLLSTAVDRYRPAYARTTQDFKRTAVLAGTTNDPYFHRDETGGRRFWPVHCPGQIDVAWLRENRDQLFAEALHRYRAGESWFDVDREEQERLIAERYSADPWEEIIATAIAGWCAHTGVCGDNVEAIKGDPTAPEERAHWGTLITNPRIMTVALGLDIKGKNRKEAIRINTCMRRRGWVQKTVRPKNSAGPTDTVTAWVREHKSPADLFSQKEQ